MKEEFKVYNSMTQQKEIFKPCDDGKVRMYVCGVTAYDYSHLGHARAAVVFDVLYRYLLHLGYEVVYVRNFTDVDDKRNCLWMETGWLYIISFLFYLFNIMHVKMVLLYVIPGEFFDCNYYSCYKLGENPLDLSNRFCGEYLYDMDDLQCLRPTHQPRVSDHMEQIIKMISQIIENGYGYAVDGDVFFSVDKSLNYGQLSGQKLENHKAGERVAIDARKRNPADFALWKAAKPGEPSWESHGVLEDQGGT
ncbi:hypothetical protein MLD38_007526 [Melastoma candidum]|uniref:Uncharacterized protein n=1 Tax=Melastoma candidum TaxID=119954 RepID=A0ACB9RUF2_9MYRT|nr:hypothetical protein MLD38_007526 [Melastoma candidum]